jgi:hypothetical protein
MADFRGWLHNLAMGLLDGLLLLYPPRFRRAFSVEIRAVIASRLSETGEGSSAAWFTQFVREVLWLSISIWQECWHELKSRKEKKMAQQDNIHEDPAGEAMLQAAGAPGRTATVGWVLLSAAVLPVAIIVTTPVIVAFMWLVNLGASAGLWAAASRTTLSMAAFVTSLAVVLAGIQAGVLRRFFPRPWRQFALSGVVFATTGLAAAAILGRLAAQSVDIFQPLAVSLLGVGLVTGLAQWLFLRRRVPRAYFLIAIHLLSAGAVSLGGRTLTNLIESLTVVLLPGIIFGLGYALLARQPAAIMLPVRPATKRRRLNRIAWTGLGLAALVPLFFVFIWMYAASQLALAKSEGAYPTVEEAVTGYHSDHWGDAQVVSVSNIRTGQNRANDQPHVWFGTATVTYDRVPAGYTKDQYLAGNYYVHTQEGWVLMPTPSPGPSPWTLVGSWPR